VLNGLNDIWRVVAAVVEMLLRISGLVAIGYIVYGGIQYVISQGQPDKTKTALQTVINALVGMAISVVATAMVTYVAGRF
jgi:NAD/NADP transhydrogenase beta subunit